jgi:lipid-binding SYLF domain-containing protein
MRSKLFTSLLCLAIASPVLAQNKEQQRLSDAGAVLKQVLYDNEGIPRAALSKAMCVAVYPGVKKVGAGIGVTYGRGVLVCHGGLQPDADWSAPAMYTLSEGSIGPQLGGNSRDYVLLIMNQHAAEKLLSGKLKVGADATAVSGPSQASAQGFNDADFGADVLIYSRSKGGLFAGAALADSSMATDSEANRELYGRPITASEIIRDKSAETPAAAQSFMAALEGPSPGR